MSDDAAGGTTGVTAQLRWGASTHQGQIRHENEDSHTAGPLLFVVADGMGGHQAGEVASALAVKTLHDRLAGGAASVDHVIASVVEANSAIFHAAHQNAGQLGMGTTLTTLVVMPGLGGQATTFALANVGDSRTYRMRNGVLERVTLDHSYVQELVSTGHITEAEARTHPRRNIVTRALGIEPTVRVDAWTLSLVRGDRFVLCSDGLVDEVPDHEIEMVVAGVRDPQAAADELVAMANRHGGRDNVTVVVVDVLQGLDLPPDDDITGANERPLQTGRGDTARQPVLGGPVYTGSGLEITTPGSGTPAVEATGAAAGRDAAAEAVAVGSGDAAGDTAIDASTSSSSSTTAATDATDAAATPTEVTPVVATPTLPPRSSGPAGSGATAATSAHEHRAVSGTAAAAPHKRRITGGMFLFFLAAALIITLTATFVLVALNNDDESPTDTVDTVDTVEVTLPATTLPPTTTTATSGSTAPGATVAGTTTTVDDGLGP